jgi:hypothetical protein
MGQEYNEKSVSCPHIIHHEWCVGVSVGSIGQPKRGLFHAIETVRIANEDQKVMKKTKLYPELYIKSLQKVEYL